MPSRRLFLFIGLSVLAHLSLLGALLFFMGRSALLESLGIGRGGGSVVLTLNVGGEGSGGPAGGAKEEKKPEEEKKTKPATSPPVKTVKKEKSSLALPSKKEEAKFSPTVPAESALKPSSSQEKGAKADLSQEGKASGGEGKGSSKGSGEGAGEKGSGGDGSGGGGNGSKVLSEIRRRIERAKRYPTSARLQHLEGVVSLSFSIEPDGQVRALALVHSSGSDVLDQEALATVKRAAPLPYYANPIRISLRFYLEENE